MTVVVVVVFLRLEALVSTAYHPGSLFHSCLLTDAVLLWMVGMFNSRCYNIKRRNYTCVFLKDDFSLLVHLITRTGEGYFLCKRNVSEGPKNGRKYTLERQHGLNLITPLEQSN